MRDTGFADAADTAASGPNLGRLLRRRLWLLLLATAAGGGLAYLQHSRKPPTYQSSARVRLVERASQIPVDALRTGLSQRPAVYDHVLLIQSPVFISQAVQEAGLKALPGFASEQQAVGAIAGGLSIASPEDSSVIDLTYRGDHREECEAVLAVIIDAYRRYLNDSQQDVNAETAVLITRAKDELLADMDRSETAYRKFREEAPLAWVGARGQNLHSARLEKIEDARAELDLERTRLRAESDALKAALARGGNREALLLAVNRTAAVSGGGGSAGGNQASLLTDRVFPLLLEKEILSEQLGPDHPKVRTLVRQIELTREHLGAKVRPGDNAPERDFLDAYLASLEQQIATVTSQSERLDALFASEQEAAKSLLSFELQDEQHRKEIARIDTLFEAVVSRLKELSLVKDVAPMRLEVLSPPGVGYELRIDLIKSLVVGAVLGLLVGFGMAYALEAADRSFRSADEIRDRLGLPVVGHIPLFPAARAAAAAAGSPLDPSLVSVHRPGSQVAEAYREVRASLFFNVRGANHSLIQITSPDASDGKSTLAANLAVSIAQSGRKTLLLDADVRKPKQAKLFGLTGKIRGLLAVMRGEIEPIDAIVPSGVENLWILPTGSSSSQAGELIVGQRFGDLLEVVRQQYDFVIVDSPPVLAVSDPATIAPRTDGVILTMRLNRRTPEKCARVLDVLARAGGNVLGVVVNGVSGGDYDGYRYGYGYGYRKYGYGYGAYGKRYENAYGETETVAPARVNGVRHVDIADRG